MTIMRVALIGVESGAIWQSRTRASSCTSRRFAATACFWATSEVLPACSYLTCPYLYLDLRLEGRSPEIPSYFPGRIPFHCSQRTM